MAHDGPEREAASLGDLLEVKLALKGQADDVEAFEFPGTGFVFEQSVDFVCVVEWID
jgi:hypothetical protein